MARHGHIAWDLPENNGTPHRHEFPVIQTALLMDLRDELRNLNQHLRCRNFIGIPETLRAIRRNTTRRKKGKNPIK